MAKKSAEKLSDKLHIKAVAVTLFKIELLKMAGVWNAITLCSLTEIRSNKSVL